MDHGFDQRPLPPHRTSQNADFRLVPDRPPGLLAAGSGAAQFMVGFSLKKLLIQVPAGIVAVWIASKIIEFDFGTIGRIAQKIAAITVLAEGVACWIPIPFFSIIADLTVMLLGFFVLFELSKWQTYLIVLLNFAVLFGAHYLLANYINQPRSYGSRPSPVVADSQANRRANPRVVLLRYTRGSSTVT